MMDSFSYCDVSSVFLTKTIDRIISPMAVQLCHLIISLECDGSNYTGMSDDLEQMAQELAKATEQLANTAVRVAAECDDGVLRQEMKQAAKTLLLFGKNFLLSVQKLIIQPTIRKHQEELVVAAQNILTGTLKLLQLDDDAGVKKIHQAADWLLETLKYIQKAESMSHLLSNFFEFSDAVLLLNCLTERRILDLKDSLHQQHLSQTLQILRKCVPMLYTATQSNIKHPYNGQMIASKLYIFDMASKTVHDLKSLLTIGPVKQHSNQRSFAQDLHHLHEILGNPKPTELNNSDLDYLAGAIIFYSMYVADCSRPNIKLRLIKHCQALLDQRKRLCDLLKEPQENPSVGKILYQLEQLCASMKVELNHLNQTLVCTIFYQILDAFAVKDPLKRLLKAALKTNKKASLNPQNLFASKAFQPLLQAFQSHTDQLLKISSLVLAQCREQKNIEEIQSSVDYLCGVKEEVVALVIDTNKAYYESKMVEKAQSIYQKWIQATECLMMSLDDMLTVHQFLELSIREIEENRYHCEKLLRSQEADLFQHHAADLCDLIERMVQVVNRHVDHSKDPIFRNGLRVLVRQLESSVLDTRTAMKKCVESISCLTTQKLFLEKVNNLFESIYSVQEGVSGCKHPDLLSPLRSEAGPVSHKPMIIDLIEFEEAKDNHSKNQGDPNNVLLYEGYLSKPLPLLNSSKEAIRNCAHIEKAIQVTDLQPIIGNLLIAIRKHNTKEVHVHIASLIEISRLYLEVVKDSFSDDTKMENYILRYKDMEDLMLSLLKFSKQGNMGSVLGMGKLIQTAILLSHRVKEIKMYLASISNYWHSFSFHLFCTSTNSELATNTQIFNNIMQRLTGIVQSVSEDLYDHHNNLEFPGSNEKQESLVKIHVMFSKCQAAANQLLTRVLCHGLQTDKHKLEDFCILWSVSVHQLSESVDDFIGIKHLFTDEIMDLTELNISKSKTLVLLCETSLWLQEASSLSVHKFTEEKEREKVKLLKEAVGSLTEAVLKVRDDINMTSPPALFLTVECGLLQKELMLKAKLLMHHMKNLYRGNQTLIYRVVNVGLSSSNSNDRSGVMGSFEQDATLLVENMNLVKEALRSVICFTKKEGVEFLVDHLFFLTTDIVARTRQLIENQHQWHRFMLEAMYLNWLAKADQLVLHLQSNTEMDVTVLKFIKQCLTTGDITETPMIDNSNGLENEATDASISVDINVSEQETAKVGLHKTSTRRQHAAANRCSSNTVCKQTAPCSRHFSKIDSSYKFSSENNLIRNEQSTIVGKQWNVLNNGHEATRRKSIKVIRSNKDLQVGPSDKHNTIFIEKDFATSSMSNESSLDHEIKSVLMESINQETYMYPQVHKNATNQAISKLKTHVITTGLQKNINCKTAGMKTQDVLAEVKNEKTKWESTKDQANKVQKSADNKETMNQETHGVFIGVQKGIANHETVNQKTHGVFTGVHKGAANEETKNQKTHEIFTGVHKGAANEETVNQKTHEVFTGLHKGAANEETVNQKTHGVFTGVHKGAANEEIGKQKTQAALTGAQEGTDNEETKIQKTQAAFNEVQSHADNQQSRVQKTHRVLTGVHRVRQIKSMKEKIRAEWIGIQKGSVSQELIHQKTHTEDIDVQKEITIQESSNQKMHNLVTTKEKKTTNQIIRDQTADMVPVHMTIDGAQTGTSNQELTNQKTDMALTTVNNTPNTHMTSNRRQKEKGNTQRVALYQRSQEKRNTEQTVPEIACSAMQGRTQYEKLQQGAFKEEKQTSFVSQRVAAMNSVETDSKQPLMFSRSPRNTTIIVEHQKVNCTSLEDVCWQPQRVAQCLLAEEVETWEGETNSIVKITREMAAQMSYMIQYLNRKGPIQTPEQFISSAKCIAAHGQTFVRFVEIMAKNCTDTRNTSGLLCGMEQIQMISNQLNIVSSVKAATGCGDYSAEEVLLKNAQNLIHSTLETWRAAEAACIRGAENPTYSEEEAEVAAFCSQLRKKLMCQRA